MDIKDEFKLLIEMFEWQNYRKKCKHCGKFNNYKMKFRSMNIDFPALFQAMDAANVVFKETYTRIVTATDEEAQGIEE